MPDMKIFAVETSCDETAIALVEAKGSLNLPAGGPQFRILANEVASQIKTHRPWGGVVPNLAKREHLANLPIIFKKIIVSPKISKVDLLAVTVGPGLEPCLWTGINFVKEIHKTYFPKAKFVGTNHLEGHLYSFLLSQKIGISKLFPAISLIASGGHTILLLMKDLTHWKKLGETRDDAAGEAFDKVAKMLGLPYPGGPEIEKLAKKGKPEAIEFPRPMMHQKNYDFSFSGLKTAVLYYLRRADSEELFGKFPIGTGRSSAPAAEDALRSRSAGPAVAGTEPGRAPRASARKFSEELVQDIAASFQAAAADVLIAKTLRAAREFEAKSIMLSGGVSANKFLQKEFRKRIKKEFPASHFLLFTSHFPTDNAAMIAAAAYINHLKGRKRRLAAQPNLSL